MKIFNLFSVCILLFSLNSFAQVGIGTTNPTGALDITSTTNGFVPPRVTLTATNVAAPVVNPQTGALTNGTIVWNTATAGTSPNNVVPGLYVWNGTIWVLINYSDGDFHEVGTSSPPDAITDDVFRTGNVAIGKTTANSALDIQDNTSTNSTSIASTGSDNLLLIQRTGSKSGTSRGIYVDYVNSDSGSDTREAISTYVRGGAGTGARYGVFNNIQSAAGGTNQIHGTYNQLASDNGTGEHRGTYNRLGGNTARTKVGVNNYITGSDTGEHIGTNNNVASTGSGNHIGTQNQMSGSGTLRGVYNTLNAASSSTKTGVETVITVGTGNNRGVYNSLGGSETGTYTGVSNFLSNAGNGELVGTSNLFGTNSGNDSGVGTGIHKGTYNNVKGAGTLYGVDNDINDTASGQTAYGIYTDVNGLAGSTNYGTYIDVYGSGTNYAAIFNRGHIIANESGENFDFRVEGDSDVNLFFTDASTDNVGIGTNSPSEKLEVNGTIKATDINFSGLPTYADDITAGIGGLTTGDVYKTAIGVLMIKL